MRLSRISLALGLGLGVVGAASAQSDLFGQGEVPFADAPAAPSTETRDVVGHRLDGYDFPSFRAFRYPVNGKPYDTSSGMAYRAARHARERKAAEGAVPGGNFLGLSAEWRLGEARGGNAKELLLRRVVVHDAVNMADEGGFGSFRVHDRFLAEVEARLESSSTRELVFQVRSNDGTATRWIFVHQAEDLGDGRWVLRFYDPALKEADRHDHVLLVESGLGISVDPRWARATSGEYTQVGYEDEVEGIGAFTAQIDARQFGVGDTWEGLAVATRGWEGYVSTGWFQAGYDPDYTDDPDAPWADLADQAETDVYLYGLADALATDGSFPFRMDEVQSLDHAKEGTGAE